MKFYDKNHVDILTKFKTVLKNVTKNCVNNYVKFKTVLKIMTKMCQKIFSVPKTVTRSTMHKTLTNETLPKSDDKLTHVNYRDNIHRANNRAKRNRDKQGSKIIVSKTLTT